ncbi:DUF3025 domain-containing protein [Polaromonas sp.]|uniref:DUF3025 domain-containing protein n=1 Tax=Polaromonas sp. TaxID=1869339 RepID=UPI00375192DF
MNAGVPAAVLPVDWDRPWLAPWRESGQRVAQAIHGGTAFHEALNAEPGAPRRFVPQSALPNGQAYEQFIFDSGTVPTRDNLHDFFNGLCWLRFPQTKAKLNELQAAQIAAAGVAPLRGPVRDALTVFDENAALLSAPEPLWDALLARQWRRLFVDLRPLWHQAQLLLFGHALLEKLVYPRKPVTAHVYRAQAAMNSIADLDVWLAQDLSAEKLAAKPFAPLPVLGVPGWWPENQNFSFYDDSLVFRPLQESRTTKNSGRAAGAT